MVVGDAPHTGLTPKSQPIVPLLLELLDVELCAAAEDTVVEGLLLEPVVCEVVGDPDEPLSELLLPCEEDGDPEEPCALLELSFEDEEELDWLAEPWFDEEDPD